MLCDDHHRKSQAHLPEQAALWDRGHIERAHQGLKNLQAEPVSGTLSLQNDDESAP